LFVVTVACPFSTVLLYAVSISKLISPPTLIGWSFEVMFMSIVIVSSSLMVTVGFISLCAALISNVSFTVKSFHPSTLVSATCIV
jgi:hypothetical protein